jgi:hypothetical protein
VKSYYLSTLHDRTPEAVFCIVDAPVHMEYRFSRASDSWVRLQGQPIRDRVFWADPLMSDGIPFAESGASHEPTPTAADIAATIAERDHLAARARREAASARREAACTHPAPTPRTQNRPDPLGAALDDLGKNPAPTQADADRVFALARSVAVDLDRDHATR